MVKICSDLKGVVVVGGTMFRAGDTVPARVKIGDHLVEKVKDGAASKDIINNNGPKSKERLRLREISYENGTWVRQALAAN